MRQLRDFWDYMNPLERVVVVSLTVCVVGIIIVVIIGR